MEMWPSLRELEERSWGKLQGEREATFIRGGGISMLKHPLWKHELTIIPKDKLGFAQRASFRCSLAVVMEKSRKAAFHILYSQT